MFRIVLFQYLQFLLNNSVKKGISGTFIDMFCMFMKNACVYKFPDFGTSAMLLYVSLFRNLWTYVTASLEKERLYS